MNWFRTNIKHGSRLALLALAVQFVLTFGHVHAPDARTGDPILSIATETVASSTQQQPAIPDSSPADLCPICAVMVLAATTLLASSPLLVLPDAVELLYLTTDAEFGHLNSARVSFQARAPPAS